jgi:hypothetical protein
MLRPALNIASDMDLRPITLFHLEILATQWVLFMREKWGFLLGRLFSFKTPIVRLLTI